MLQKALGAFVTLLLDYESHRFGIMEIAGLSQMYLIKRNSISIGNASFPCIATCGSKFPASPAALCVAFRALQIAISTLRFFAERYVLLGSAEHAKIASASATRREGA